MDDEFAAGDLFQDPEGYYPEDAPPTFAEHCMLSGQIVRVRLVGDHPLYGNLLWNAGRTSSHYIEEHSEDLIRNKDVLEIGAAAGVPSIVSAIQGARTVVLTDYPDPDLVENMKYNAELSANAIPAREDGKPRLHVDGYKWGSDQTLKKDPNSVALVIFTPYQPWLLPKTEQFFPLAEASGFTVTKIFEKVVDAVLFEEDPGDERLRRTVFGYEIRWAQDQLDSSKAV
ncbi:Nicotinamide N-methyltransferase [Penicillium coprophilum]|uniref:Nicotinamide N-methyltransferase n=1 Tax=Penicillium coprophilum TaxID=36646 RepID=UPI0023970D03|nr:Nicotinamide N-methyltransferase [Penicillium coprophilum]KAJ5155099.1 Nicotinamide N-methyltransferase [Penicillium coprophilum]